MIERIKKNSLEEGFAQSRLPEFTVEEQDLLKGSLDFLGINHFATLSCHSDYNHAYRPSYNFDFGIGEYFDSLPKSGPLFEPVPSGLTKLLVWLKSHYGDIPIIITENGCADDGKIQDVERAEYLKNFLYAVLKAIHEEKCNVKGYIVWSLMDNVEWMLGYTARFGLYSVDFEKPERPRTRKLSSYVFADIVTKKCINWDYTP